jgi:hypothetical protein
MAEEIATVMRELGEVQDRLAALGKGPRGDRLSLLMREEELRTRAARLADEIDARDSTQALLVHLAELRRKEAALDRQHRSSPTGPHRSTPTTAPLIEKRIRRVEELLAKRGVILR